MTKTLGKSALIIGGSMAGLLAARVLREHFERVIIVEKDLLSNQPEARKSQPQARHLHGLLLKGLDTLQYYFPGFIEELEASTYSMVDMGESMQWFCFGGYRARFTFGCKNLAASRPFLEWKIRQRVLTLPEITVRDGCRVDSLVLSQDRRRVTGVKLRKTDSGGEDETLEADLVMDCAGRGAQTIKWLTEAGYNPPEESTVTCGTGYTSRKYERNPGEPSSKDWILITPDAPKERRLGGAFPIENNQWIVSLSGWHGDHAPTDDEGFEAFAKSLPAPDIYQIVRTCRPVSPIVVHKYPASTRWHYEKLKHFPEGYLVLGDAACSFNPLYGQGMTSAILQAAQLDKVLQKQKGQLQGLYKPYFKRVARIIDIPWQTAVGEDFRFAETKGKKAPGTDLINAYVARVHRTSHRDPVVGAAFLKVLNMLEPPAHLFHPRVLWRVLRPW